MRWLADGRVLLPLPVTFDAALSFCFALVRPSRMSALVNSGHSPATFRRQLTKLIKI